MEATKHTSYTIQVNSDEFEILQAGLEAGYTALRDEKASEELAGKVFITLGKLKAVKEHDYVRG